MPRRRYPPPRAASLDPKVAMLAHAAVKLRSRTNLLPPVLSERTAADIDPARRFDSTSFSWAAAPTGGGGGSSGGGGGGTDPGVSDPNAPGWNQP